MIGTSGRQRVPNKVFDKLYFDIPSLSEQKEILTKLRLLEHNISNFKEQKIKTKNLRNKLSNELLSGKLRLEEGK